MFLCRVPSQQVCTPRSTSGPVSWVTGMAAATIHCGTLQAVLQSECAAGMGMYIQATGGCVDVPDKPCLCFATKAYQYVY